MTPEEIQEQLRKLQRLVKKLERQGGSNVKLTPEEEEYHRVRMAAKHYPGRTTIPFPKRVCSVIERKYNLNRDGDK